MKKGIRVLLLTLLCAALFCVTAYADDAGGMFAISMSDGATAVPQLADGTAAEAVSAEIPQGTEILDYYEGAKKISLSYSSGIQSGANYLVMVIKGSNPLPAVDTVVYIDQVKADGDTVSYNIYPMSLEIGETYHIYIASDANPEAGLAEIGSFQYGKDQKLYKIKFYNEDGVTELGTFDFYRGDMPAYNGENPTKGPDDQYCYEFDKWVPEITAVAGDASYTASYKQNAHEYGEPVWTWEWDYSAAKLEFTCSVGGETKTIDAAVTSEAGVAPGSTIYTATAQFQGITYTDRKSASSLILNVNGNTLSLNVDETVQLHVYNTASEEVVDGTLFLWESDDSSVANVDASGNVTGISGGSTQVHVSASDGSFEASCEVTVRPNIQFADVSDPDVFFYDPVYWAVSQGITTGRTPTTFDPYGQCTRGHIVTFLWRAMGEPEPTVDNPFEDVHEGDSFYKAVLWAYEYGITTGQTETTFGPWNTCTRGQIVTFLWRAFGEQEPEITENPFEDVEEDKYYCKPVLWAVGYGITTGRTPTTFDPWATCTRGQAVTFIYRAFN